MCLEVSENLFRVILPLNCLMPARLMVDRTKQQAGCMRISKKFAFYIEKSVESLPALLGQL